MKPFNKQRALAGDPVVYIGACDGEKRPARILCGDRRTRAGANYSIVALVSFDDEELPIHSNDEGVMPNGYQVLFMAPVKKQAWLNIYSDGCGRFNCGPGGHLTKEDALSQLGVKTDAYLTTVLIEWEE